MGRFELKYIVPLDLYNALVDYAQTYAYRDANLKGKDTYHVKSLYYDSENFDLYNENIEGLPRRKKVRLRTYGKRNDAVKFLEIKEKVKNKIYKRKIEVTQHSFSENLYLDLLKLDLDNSVLTELKLMCLNYDLNAKVYTEYDRLAMLDHYDSNFRLTLDTNMSSSILDKTFPNSLNRNMLSQEEVFILELKGSGHLPLWCTSMVKIFSLKLSKFSKYVNAVNTQNLLVQNPKGL